MASRPSYSRQGSGANGQAATPVVFKHGHVPWAVQTPDSSPMLYEPEPTAAGYSGRSPHSAKAVSFISRELLRSVCEPFFDQMLVALEAALQKKLMKAEAEADDVAHSSSINSMKAQLQEQLLRSQRSEEDSDTEAKGAFSTLFAAPEPNASTDTQTAPIAPSAMGVAEPESSPSDKRGMVCRHWKSKGWCKLESACKFQHPDSKRGSTAHKDPLMARSSSGQGETDVADSDGAAPPTSSSSRSARRRRARVKAAAEGADRINTPQSDVVAPDASGMTLQRRPPPEDVLSCELSDHTPL